MGIYTILIVAFRIPVVQEHIADLTEKLLCEKLGTKVIIDKVNPGFLNRFIIDGVEIYDQQSEKMLCAKRLSAGIDLLQLLEGRISISSAQIFGLDANIHKQTMDSPLNCQFLIDSLSSKEKKEPSKIDLTIASLVIRNGAINYDVWSEPNNHKIITPNHLSIEKLSSHIIIYSIKDGAIDAELKKLSFHEKRGFDLNNLAATFKMNNGQIQIKELNLQLPHSALTIPSLELQYAKSNGKMRYKQMAGSIHCTRLSPDDIQPFIATDITKIPDVTFSADIDGSDEFAQGHLDIATFDNNLKLKTNYQLSNMQTDLGWAVSAFQLNAKNDLFQTLSGVFTMPEILAKVGDIEMSGKANGTKASVTTDLNVKSTALGIADVKAFLDATTLNMEAALNDIALATLLPDSKLGNFTGKVNAKAKLNEKKIVSAEGNIDINELAFSGYNYHDISIDGNYSNIAAGDKISAVIKSKDPNIEALIDATTVITNGKPGNIMLNADVNRLVPSALNITDTWGNGSFRFNIDGNIDIQHEDDFVGYVTVNDLYFNGTHKNNLKDGETIVAGNEFLLNNLTIASEHLAGNERHTTITSDFCHFNINGNYSAGSLATSVTNIIKKNFPSVPGLPEIRHTNNDATFNGTINSLEFLHRIAGVNAQIEGTAELKGYINDANETANIYVSLPKAHIANNNLKDFKLLLWTPDNSLHATLTSHLLTGKNDLQLRLDAQASDDVLNSTLKCTNATTNTFSGTLNSTTRGFTTLDGKRGLEVNITPSDLHLDKTIWHLTSKNIRYYDKRLEINSFALENKNQHLFINGVASESPRDSLVADLKNLNVEYIMNLVNFHSVDFAGFATGKAIGKQLFKTPEANAHLDVSDFHFETGALGTLSVDAKLNNELRQIDVDGVAKDSVSHLDIKGFVSPQRKQLYLDLGAKHTRLNFLEKYTSSFANNMDLYCDGNVIVAGPFSNVNLEGKVVAQGAVDITSLNCRYTIPGDTVTLIPDDIRISHQPLMDKYGHKASISGALHHQHLSHMTYDFDIDADNLLAYDVEDFGEDTFYGRAFLSGRCRLDGRSSELNINVQGDVKPGSYVVYNASSPDAIANQEFITWHSVSEKLRLATERDSLQHHNANAKKNDVRTNIHMTFLVNVDEGSDLRIIMDNSTGDFINFNGHGALHAQYYNKGGLDIFGNYYVDKGQYRMTIQNVLRRDFEFLPGGVLKFNGEPFSAQLDLKAQYTLNSVPLSDLSIGKSFSNNNVRVDCLMNITGTAGAPAVDFSFDLPTVNNDAKQMIYSLLSSEEEIRQQVVYLLAVGRFYNMDTNNAEQDAAYNQTNMAMQSLLSGTISQQIGNMLGSFINTNKWTIGANISPGDEGFSNAEYEGIFNGAFLGNRLLINGQVGYRDNAATSTQGFIGDFDIRYLLVPSGNIALKVYNQANDRYFTRNSLNTQGLGLVLKTDYDSWRQLIFPKKKKPIKVPYK